MITVIRVIKLIYRRKSIIEKKKIQKEKKKQTNKLDLIKIFVRQTTKEIILLLMSQILNGNVKNC